MKAELVREDKEGALHPYPGVWYLKLSEILAVGNLAMRDMKILSWGSDSITLILRNLDEPHKNEEQPHEPLVKQVAATTGTRRNGYGRPLLNFLRIGILWTDHLQSNGQLVTGNFIDPEEVALMMVLLKIARQENSHSDDNLLDTMGYMDCLDNINQHMKELGFADGIEHFREMSYTDLLSLRDRLAVE